eukprot:1158192-Pelagomonas_calceolata.AAC.5
MKGVRMNCSFLKDRLAVSQGSRPFASVTWLAGATNAPAASPWTNAAVAQEESSSSSVGRSEAPDAASASREMDGGAYPYDAADSSRRAGARSSGKQMSQGPEAAWSSSNMAGASKPGHDSKVAGASETGAKSTMAGARSSGKRVSQGRGGSASGRVWPMDPPELTEAISRCASLKGGW